jgi:hypothetical protein
MKNKVWYRSMFVACFLLISTFLLMPAAYPAPLAHILAVKLNTDFSGGPSSYGFSVYGMTPPAFDYLRLISPGGTPLADSRYDYFSSVPGSGYELYAGNYATVETGFYRLEKCYQGSCEVFVLPFEVTSADIPDKVSPITNPTPNSLNVGPSVKFTWEAFPIYGDETVLYYIEVYNQNFSQVQHVGQALEATFYLPVEKYVVCLFATGVTTITVNEGEPDEYQFSYYRQGLSGFQFEIVASPPEILDFINQSTSDGLLEGSGPGSSAKGRLTALMNMIAEAGHLIASGDTARACTQLADAYNRTDGVEKPPDFVAGEAAADLAQMIRGLRIALGCR